MGFWDIFPTHMVRSTQLDFKNSENAEETAIVCFVFFIQSQIIKANVFPFPV